MKKKTKVFIGFIALCIVTSTAMVGTGFVYVWTLKGQISTVLTRIDNALDEYQKLLPLVKDTIKELNRLKMYVNTTVTNLLPPIPDFKLP